MHKLIYLPIYFCRTCFGLSFSPSSEASLLDMVAGPGRKHHTQETLITVKFPHRHLNMGKKKARNM
jgi:hypothetical protein